MTTRRSQLQSILPNLRDRAGAYDVSREWPSDDLDDLARVGAARWTIPKSFGGDEVEPLDLHLLYEAIASASLSTALVWTQRDSAANFIAGSDNQALASDVLPQLARNEFFSTVGVAQLTTSRQGGKPALVATRMGDRFELNGFVPWSTGADHSRYVVAGAAAGGAEDQILFLLPADAPGVSVDEPMHMVALASSHTASIQCNRVTLDASLILSGPKPRVMAQRNRSVPIGQAFLAMGHSRGALNLIEQHSSQRARDSYHELDGQLTALREQVIAFCETPEPPETGPRLRGECNELALRITQTAVALYKGTALLEDHPAQRLAREAMFLLVWSCPDPVIDCTVELLRGG